MTDWNDHKLHREEVIRTQGRWIGLLDGNGHPICDLPPNPIELEAPQQRMAIASLRMTINVGSRWGAKHPALRALIDDTLGVTDSGAIKPTPTTRFVAIETPVGHRQAWRVGQRGTPHLADTLTIHAVDVLQYLQQIPSVSQPAKWAQQGGWFTADRDWLSTVDQAHRFDTPREVREVDFSTSYLADNVLDGPADVVIHQALSESLQAVFAAIERRQVIQVEDLTPTPGIPRMTYKPSDGWLWTELAPRASAAGVDLAASMWFPGDPQPVGLTLHSPTIVIRVSGGRQLL